MTTIISIVQYTDKPIGVMSYTKFDHDEFAKTRAPDDFWGQVRRTVQGVPVSDDQIRMIVNAICSGLDLNEKDALLDLACGNGALSHLLFDSCSGYLGVDLSGHMISVAKANFENRPHYRFKRQGAAEFVLSESQPERFSKVLCYGSFQYFSAADAAMILRMLSEKFCNVTTVFIGNLPDKERAAEFYKRLPDVEELADCQSQIGIWRTRAEFEQLAIDTGWKVKISNMSDDFYASYYRFDVTLGR